MPAVNLKEYTARAVELEAAIYTQKTLMAKHKQIRKEQSPDEPIKRYVIMPTKPEKPTTNTPKLVSPTVWKISAIYLSLCAVGAVGLGFWMFGLGDALLGLFLLAIGGGIAYAVYYGYNKRKEIEAIVEQTENAYIQEYAKYEQLMRQYNSDIARADREYDVARNQHRNEVSAYNTKTNALLAQHYDALSSLEKALQALYDENVVYPKYRNMVAMTTINEYLMSGRCSELEGPNGAYNLYEMELRQNIIINQLSNIVNNLEQIRNSQFLLYRELMKANDTVEQICYELRKLNTTAKLDAYFNAVSAKIAASPKIITGIIH